MKDLIKIVFALFIAVSVASCSKESSQIEQVGDKSTVTITAVIPQYTATKAISDGKGATMLKYSVYDLNGNKIPGLDGKATIVGSSAVINMRLVKDMSYKIIFWAQNPQCDAYNTTDLSAIKVDYTGNANDDARDAFVAVEEIYVTGTFNRKVTLRRPFAQINLGATDRYGVVDNGKEMKSSIYIEGVPDTFYPLENSVSGDATVDFKPALFPGAPATLTVDSESYGYVSMNYILAPAEQDALNKIEARFVLPDGYEINFPISSIPYQANYRTNILGRFFTSVVTFNIVVDAEFDNQEYTIN